MYCAFGKFSNEKSFLAKRYIRLSCIVLMVPSWHHERYYYLDYIFLIFRLVEFFFNGIYFFYDEYSKKDVSFSIESSLLMVEVDP